MPWTYKHNPALQIIEVAFSGKITADDLKELTSKCIALEKEEGLNRFLIDTTEMQLTASLFDVYNLPAVQYIEEEADRTGRVALVLSTSHRENQAVKFYEVACKNRGWNAQAFSGRDEAINWLTRSSL